MAKRGPKAKTAENSRSQSAGPISWQGIRPPEDLSPGAKDEYVRLVKILRGAGTLDRADPRMIELYAINYDLAKQAHATLQKEGLVTYTQEGRSVAHPLLTVINTATIRLRGIMNDLGLTPASSKLSSPVGKAEGDDPWGGLLDVVG